MYYGTSFNIYTNAETTVNFLKKKGYVIRTVGSIIREIRPKFKTKKETLKTLEITRGVYELLVAYKPGDMSKVFTLVEILTVKLEIELDKSGRNRGTSCLWTAFSGRNRLGDYHIDHQMRKEVKNLLRTEIDIYIY